MIWKAGLVLSLALCVLSGKRPATSKQMIELFSGHHGHLSHIGQHEPEHHEIYAWAYPSYEFSYHVDDPHTHDMKGQHEIRDGDKVTGNYWLIQPDGRKRTVKYRSDHKNGFQAKVYYQPHDGHHYEVKQHHERNHGHEGRHRWEDERRGIGKSRGNQWDGNNDMRRRIGIDERRDGDHDERQHDDKRDHDDRLGHDIKRDHDDKRSHDDKRGHDDNRGHDDKRSHDDKNSHDDRHDHKDNSWGWIKQRKEHKDNHREGLKDNIGYRRLGHGHEEHWKHGNLVGWREGIDSDSHHRDKDNHHGYRDNHNRDRDDRYKARDNSYRGDDKRSNDSHDDHRGQNSYQEPRIHFKSLIPYGQRLD